MNKRLMFALIAALGMTSSPATADDFPLVGDWLTASFDPRNVTDYPLHARFTSDGQLLLIGEVQVDGVSGEVMARSRYRLSGRSSYHAVVFDYEPRAIPPLLGGPPGTQFDCTFRFENYYTVDIRCANQNLVRYTRQN